MVSLRETVPLHRRKTMLVLSRKKDESIVIRDDIIVTVVEVRCNKVRLGIDVPKEVTVYRCEIYDKIKKGEGLRS